MAYEEDDDYEVYEEPEVEEPEVEESVPEPEPEPEPAPAADEGQPEPEPEPVSVAEDEPPETPLPRDQYAAAATGTRTDASPTAKDDDFEIYRDPTPAPAARGAAPAAAAPVTKAAEPEDDFEIYRDPTSVIKGLGVTAKDTGASALHGVGSVIRSGSIVAPNPYDVPQAEPPAPAPQTPEEAEAAGPAFSSPRIGRRERLGAEQQKTVNREAQQQVIDEAKKVPFEERTGAKLGGWLQEQGKKIESTAREKEDYPIYSKTGQVVGGAGAALLVGAAGTVAGGPLVGLGAAGLVGAAQSAGDTYDRAVATINQRIAAAQKAGDATTAKKLLDTRDDTAAKAAGFSAVVNGTLGVIPIGMVLRPVKDIAPGAMGRIWAMADHAFKGAPVFAGVGEAQRYLGEQMAKDFDPKAKYEFNYQDVIASLLGGGILSAGGAAVQRRPPPAPEPPKPEFVDQPGVKNSEWKGPPGNIAEAVPPEQGRLPFPTEAGPYDIRKGPQEAQIGGGETQLGLPIPEPKPPARPGVTAQPELALEPPPVVNREGQLGFSIDAPHPDSVNRPAMPPTAGVAKEAAPPGPLPKEPEAQPHSAVKEGMAQEAMGVTPQAAKGINVLQPGQVDPAIQHATAYPAGPKTQFEKPRPPDGSLPGEKFAPLPPDRSLVPRPADTRQAVTETPVPDGHTRMYQGERQPSNAFTTDRKAAEQYGPVTFVDVHNKQGLPFFSQTNEPGSFTTRNNIYRTRARPIEEVTTEPVAGPAPPAAPEPVPVAPKPKPPDVKTASPELDLQISEAIKPPAPPPAPAPAPAPAPVAPKPPAPKPVVPMKPPAKVGDQIPVSYGEVSKGSGKIDVTGTGKVLSKSSFSQSIDKHGTRKGLLGPLTTFVQKTVRKTIGDMPVYVVSHKDMIKHGEAKTIAFYDPNRNHIVVNARYINDKYAMQHAILHEGVHAVTYHAAQHIPKVKAIIEGIMGDVQAQHLYKQALSGKAEIKQELRYGFQDVHEFLAETHSNEKFQGFLKAHDLSPDVAKVARDYFGWHAPKMSAWDAIVQTVRKLLNIHPSQMGALEAVMRATEHAMELNPTVKEKFLGGKGIETDYTQPLQRSVAPKEENRVRVYGSGGPKIFTGKDVHDAAAKAKAAGHQPYEIHNMDMSIYKPSKATPAATTPPVAAAPAPAAPAQPGGGGAGKPPAAPAQSTLVPATKSDLATGLGASLRRMFVPMRSESAQVAGAALRKAAGPLARIREQAAARFTNDLHKIANTLDGPAFEKFVDLYESGKVSSLPKEQQALAHVLKKNYDDFWNEIKKLPGTEKMEAVKDYLTHMYDNGNGQAERFAKEYYSSSGGSLKERTHPTFADARAAGLKPLSNNPIEHFVRYSEGISHHLAQRQMMVDLTAQNRIGYFGPKTVGASGAPEPLVLRAPPEGYSELKMPWAEKHGRKAFAPRDVAETLNQFYDAGLRRGQAKDMVEYLQMTKNMWTAVELGLSAYHATTMGVESVASGMARALQMAASGNYKDATAQLFKAPVEPITAYLHGREARKVYRGEKAASTPLQQRIIDLFTEANVQPGNLRITGEYDMTRMGNFWDSYKRGSLPHEFNAQLKAISDSYGLRLPAVLLENVRRAMQTISKPLFEHYIPELKLGTMMKDMEAWLHANPKATDAQALAYARKISDSVDNRMGEMNYDNLFMNKAAKDLGMLSLRSFGFTVGGPIREIGAGAGRLALTAAQGKNPLKHFDLRSDKADPRTAYAMAFLPAIAAISAVYQGLRTGELPSDWRDLVTPKTGGKIKSVGKESDERILVPGYHKDFLGYFVNPQGFQHEIEAKLAAPWTTLKEQLTGKDWRGKHYVPPRATTLEWLQAHGKQLGSHMIPIGPKQLYEGTRPGSKLTLPEQMLGVRTPGGYMLNPESTEKYNTKQRQRDWAADEKAENRRRRERGEESLPRRPLPRLSP